MLDLIDIGANLTHDSFDADREAVLARAASAGVRRIVVTGTSVTSSVQAAALCEAKPEALFATAGVHPHHAGGFRRSYDGGSALVARCPEVRRRRRVRPRLLPRLLPARRAAARLHGATRARGGRREARVPAPARRARGVHRAARAATALDSPAASRTASRAARRSSRRTSSSTYTSASRVGFATSAAEPICAPPCR